MFGLGMSNDDFNSHLETIAKLIEAQASTIAEAAQIVRDAKIHGDHENFLKTSLDFASENLALPEVRVDKKHDA